MKTLDLLKQLEINYKLISNDLEYSSHALDSFLKAAARCDSSFPDLHALPCRIGELRSSIDALATDADEVIRQRNEVAPGLKEAMLDNHTAMVGLYSRLGVAPDPDWVAMADEVKQITPGKRVIAAAEHKEDTQDQLTGCPRTAYFLAESFPENLLGDNECVRTFLLPSEQLRKAVWNPSVNQEKRAWEERLHQLKPGREPGRVERKGRQRAPRMISEEDFLAVPSSTRGRAKLEDVRKVYTKVREYCEEKSSRDRSGSRLGVISKKELGAAGLKVFGQTGDCTLNTLRTIGLIEVAKTDVTLASPTA